MTSRSLGLAAALGSVLLLGGAFLFQLAGYPPCAMCLWQRWPHAAAIALGAVLLVWGHRGLMWLGALAMAITGGIGVYHTGVERDWWEGPSSCTGTGGGLGDMSGADLLSTDGPQLVLCDVVSWQFLTLSMASWNALFSFALMALWIVAATRRT